MSVQRIQCDDQGSISSGDCGGGVPFLILRSPVLEVYSLPEWVIARVERPAIDIEFVGEYEIILESVEPCSSLGRVGCLGVDELREVGSDKKG